MQTSTGKLPDEAQPVVKELTAPPSFSCDELMERVRAVLVNKTETRRLEAPTDQPTTCLSYLKNSKRKGVRRDEIWNSLRRPELSEYIPIVLINGWHGDFLVGLLELFGQNGVLPDDKQKFLNFANNISVVERRQPFHLTGEPYTAQLFWDLYSSIKTTGRVPEH